MAPPPPKPQSSSSGSARSSISSGTSLELPIGNSSRAPRRTDQGQGDGGFLFVDSQADTAENHALKKEKQAFALNKYFRRRREAAIERVKPSKPLPSSSRRRGEQQSQSGKQTTGDEEGTEEGHFQQHDFNDSDAIVQYTQAQSLTTYLSQGHTDPFASVALEMTNPRYSYFYHFRTHTIPACYPLDATRISTYWWRQAITQPALLQALMFLAAGHQASLQLTNNAHGRNSQETAFRALKDSLRSRGDSLKLLQDIIRDPGWAVAESTGLAIATLVTIEAVNANFAAVEAHAKGLRRVFDLFGGLERADHMFLSKIYLSDVKAAALTNTRPSYPIFPKWRNAILQHANLYQFETSTRTSAGQGQPTHELKLMTPRHLCTLGTSIFKAPWYPGLDPSMKTFLKVFLRLLVYYESAVLTPELVMDTDNDLYILFEHQLLDTRYTTADRVITTAEDEAEMSVSLSLDLKNSPLNEPLRLTLLTFLTTRMWHLQPFPAMEYTTRYLKEALCSTLFSEETDRDRDPETALTTDAGTDLNTVLQYLTMTAPDLLFWILFVGGMASQSYTSYPWFVDNLAVSVRSLGLWEWGQARKVLGGFFWCDQAGLKRAEEVLWRDVLGKAATIEWEENRNDPEV
ncbi:hypothetical protein BJX66DRAFT_323635 [Aspergillus keveii]|uniref:Tachykinin family protein n=1 Tax=Aspergillus keveii TaxID=714993 RepID=A0ABR4GD81_9EURO